MKSKRTKACDFSAKNREIIKERDRGCLFCRKRYRMERADQYNTSILEIMHYIPRSQGGLGIPQNAAVGCKYHHQMMDEGEHRQEMRGIMRMYLMCMYKGWDERDLVYTKGRV
jgi:hypothetical protein